VHRAGRDQRASPALCCAQVADTAKPPARERPASGAAAAAAAAPAPAPAPPAYLGSAKPENEERRLDCLCKLNILDTAPEQRFDSITKLCSSIFKVPIALVSLVHDERQWFKSTVGLDAPQTDRSSSFCAW
jgi:hypothetical protein